LNLRAHNLQVFNTIADGVDDKIWLFHLPNGDYSRRFRQPIKDSELAGEVHSTERDLPDDAANSRRRVLEAMVRQYTLAA